MHPSAAEPVTSVPVIYERSYGGFDRSSPHPTEQRLDTRNPVGCGLVRKRASNCRTLNTLAGACMMPALRDLVRWTATGRLDVS